MQLIESRQPQLLVVDHDGTSSAALCEMLASLGYDLAQAVGLEAASTCLVGRNADIVLLHVGQIPTEGLGSAICRLRQASGTTWMPVLLLAERADESAVAQALQSGADDVLMLPIGGALLDAKLTRWSHTLQRQLSTARLVQRQRDIQDNILDSVLTLDEDGRAVEANLAACQTFGGGRPDALVTRDIATVAACARNALLAGGRMSLRRGDGTHFQADVSVSQWMEGEGTRTTLVVRDLTEQLRIDRMRDEFVATVSHELRTPLTSVLGAIGLLTSGAAGALPIQAIPLAAAVQRNGVRLSKLIDDILDLTKLEGDRMALRLKVKPLARVIQEAISANQGYASGLGVYLRAEMAEPALADALVSVDADRLQQVFGNLLSNAIKHSPRGETVVVRLSTRSDGLCVSVSDNGPGVAADFRQRLFEKFSQEDTSDRRSQGGTGLGLYIARLLVEQMAGRISADTPASRGATFSVWLPRAPSDANVFPEAHERAPPSATWPTEDSHAG
ncbi:ATP-binding protein [Variovorax sp. N23]|uniref:ATP-binding response regulator n=1 Tax=Variovorax sp. N23 TaxID=2980555 RepID=UPI0021C57118|nr:ATP-binding protein [Variovorax sp. N23]MCU4118665.1 ATP-binding protein [Variovorax sp. N23]